METKICKNCLRIHMVDERVSSPTCKCIRPEVVSLQSYFSSVDAMVPVFLNDYVRQFVINHELYEFAFKCFDAPYDANLSEKIKKAVVYRTYFTNKEIVELLTDTSLLFDFFKGFDIKLRNYVTECNRRELLR